MPNPARVQIGNARTRRQWERFQHIWDHCERCEISRTRTKVVHVQGRLPCTVLFIGEAPGSNEDISGYPFTGPAGKLLLDHIIPDVQQAYGHKFTFAIINVIGCLPWHVTENAVGEFRTNPENKPTTQEVLNCSVHRDQLIYMAQPRACVLLGKVPTAYIGPIVIGRENKPLRTLSAYHPSYLLRSGGVQAAAYAPTIELIVNYLRTLLPQRTTHGT